MREIERYKFFRVSDFGPGMRRSDDGEYVRYSDHEAGIQELEAEVERLRGNEAIADELRLRELDRAEEAEAENERLRAELELERDAATMEAFDAIGLRVDLREAQQALSTLRSKVAEEIVRMRRCCFICEWRARAFQALLDETADDAGEESEG